LGKSLNLIGEKAEIILANYITLRMEHMKAIEAQNKKFKEIAWIQSNLVRAPLARIMGIVDLILDEHTTPEERLGFIPHIQNSALELDQIIKDIFTKTKNIA
jgi:light-regulated signal transduction histidine kinase (bacteriophytochrome)